MTIDLAQVYIDKIAENIKVEKFKSHAFFKYKEYYKDLIMKIILELEDDVVVATIVKKTKRNNLELRW